MEIQPLEEIIDREMDRKEFLLYVGALLLVITGVSGMVKTLMPTARDTGAMSHQQAGYGNRPYGR